MSGLFVEPGGWQLVINNEGPPATVFRARTMAALEGWVLETTVDVTGHEEDDFESSFYGPFKSHDLAMVEATRINKLIVSELAKTIDDLVKLVGPRGLSKGGDT